MKRLTPWIGWIAAFALAGSRWLPPQDIEARSLVIRDAKGQRRITLAADANGKASLTLSNGKGLDRIALVAKDEFSWVNFLDSKGQFASGMIGTGNGKSWYEQRTADKKNNFFFDFNVARLSYEWAHQERGEEFRRQAKLIGVNNLLPRTQRVIEEIGGLDQFTQPLPNLTSASP